MKHKALARELFEWPIAIGYMAHIGRNLRGQTTFDWAEEVRVHMEQAVNTGTARTTELAPATPRIQKQWAAHLKQQREAFKETANEYQRLVHQPSTFL